MLYSIFILSLAGLFISSLKGTILFNSELGISLILQAGPRQLMLRLFAFDFGSHRMVALAADRLVHIFAADHLGDVLWGCADVKRSCVVAKAANCLQLLDFLTLGHELNDCVEHGSHAGRIQSCHNDNFA